MSEKPPQLDPFDCGPMQLQQHVGYINAQSVVLDRESTILEREKKLIELADALREIDGAAKDVATGSTVGVNPRWLRDTIAAALAGQPTVCAHQQRVTELEKNLRTTAQWFHGEHHLYTPTSEPRFEECKVLPCVHNAAALGSQPTVCAHQQRVTELEREMRDLIGHYGAVCLARHITMGHAQEWADCPTHICTDARNRVAATLSEGSTNG